MRMSLATTETTFLKPQSIFLNRNFMLLFSGKIISQIGDQVYLFALGWYILDITKSSLIMSLIMVINTLIFAIFAPFGGMIADRANRKAIMVWMDIIRCVIVLLTVLILNQHFMQIGAIYLNIVILAFCGAIFAPAATAIIPNVVDERQLAKASSMDQFTWSFCLVIGMLVSSILYKLVGLNAIFLFNAASFLISGVMEACVHLSGKSQNHVPNNFSVNQRLHKAIQEIHEGYQYVKNNKLVFHLILTNAMINFIVMSGGIFFIYIFNVILKAVPLQLALSQSSGYIGVITASFLVPLFLKHIQPKRTIGWGLLVYSLGILSLTIIFLPPWKAYFNNWGVTALFSVTGIITGLAVACFIIPINTIFQKYTTDEYRGRVWGLQISVITLAGAIGYFIGGFLAQKVGMGFLLAGSAIFVLIIDLWVVSLKEIKELKD